MSNHADNVSGTVLDLAEECRVLSISKAQGAAATVGRSLGTRHDPGFGWSDAIRRAEQVVDADRELVPWVENRIVDTYRGPGRPAELSVRAFLVSAIAYMLRGDGRFLLRGLHLAMLDFPLRDQIRLGITRTRHGQPAALTYAHVLGAQRRIAAAFDAEGSHLDEESRSARFAHRQQLVARLLEATLPDDGYPGGFAMDGTFIPAYHRPTRRHRRQRRRNTNTGEVTVHNLEPSPDEAGTKWYRASDNRALKPQPTTPTEVADARTELARAGDSMYIGYPTLDGDAGFHVRGDHVAWGYNAVTMVRSAPGSPQLIEHFIMSGGNGHEMGNGLRALQDIAGEEHCRAGSPVMLGQVVADKAFTQYDEFWDELRRLGGTPIADLNKRQQTARITEFANGDTAVTVDGHTYCGCLPAKLRNLRRPGGASATAAADYHDSLSRREPFRYKPNGTAPTRSNGAWPHLAPHHKSGRGDQPGGCDHCTNPDGTPVTSPDGHPLVRCCTQRTQQLYPDGYRWRQPAIFGTIEWERLYGRRNITESNNAALTYHHTHLGTPGAIRLRHLANYTLATLFAAIATNINMTRAWQAQQDLDNTDAATGPAAAPPPSPRGRTSPSNRAEPSRPRPPRQPRHRTGPEPGAGRDPTGFPGLYQ